MNPHIHKQRLLLAFHVLLAGFVLTIIVVSAWGLTHLSTDGLIVSSETHIVSFVDPFSDNAGKLRLGDIVRSINGISLEDEAAAIAQCISQLQSGSELTFEIARPGAGGSQSTLHVPILMGPPSWLMSLLLLGATITALAFWLVSLPVLFFVPDEGRDYLFFYFCQIWAAFLGAATLTPQSQTVTLLYALLTWGLGAVTIHFHCYFPVSLAQPRKWWIVAGYTVAGLGGLLQMALYLQPRLLADQAQLTWSAEAGVLRFSWLLLTLILAILFIVRTYLFSQTSPYTRRQVGLITVGGLLAFLPLIVFSALPKFLQGYPILPYLATVYFLTAIPLTYGYAALQFKFIHFGRYASRSSTLLRYQREVVRAREEERKRIARELHDQLIQALVGLKYQIVGLKQFAGAEPVNGEQHEQIARLHAEIGDLIQTTRSLCNDLRPPALDLGLIPSIRSLVSRFQQTNGITVHLHVDGDRHTVIPEDVALCLFRCTHEALTNIARHAAAQNAYVYIGVDAARVTLKVKDDGQGFVRPERLGSLMEMQHFGLVSMRERVELLHGAFTIQSGLGQGTEVTAAIALP